MFYSVPFEYINVYNNQRQETRIKYHIHFTTHAQLQPRVFTFTYIIIIIYKSLHIVYMCALYNVVHNEGKYEKNKKVELMGRDPTYNVYVKFTLELSPR